MPQAFWTEKDPSCLPVVGKTAGLRLLFRSHQPIASYSNGFVLVAVEQSFANAPTSHITPPHSIGS